MDPLREEERNIAMKDINVYISFHAPTGSVIFEGSYTFNFT